MQTNGTMPKLEGGGGDNQGNFQAPTTYSLLQKTQIQIALIPKKWGKEEFAPMHLRTHAIYMQVEKYPPTLKRSYIAEKGEDVSKESMIFSTYLT